LTGAEVQFYFEVHNGKETGEESRQEAEEKVNRL